MMSELFQIKNVKYNLRKGDVLLTDIIKTVSHGTETVSYLAAKIWEQIPDDTKNSVSLISFKQKIKFWTPKSVSM